MLAVVPNTDNSMRGRTDGCIVMLPTGNRTGSVKLMSLSTGLLITRDNFEVLPIPQSAIDRMNALAAADGRLQFHNNIPTIPASQQRSARGAKPCSAAVDEEHEQLEVPSHVAAAAEPRADEQHEPEGPINNSDGAAEGSVTRLNYQPFFLDKHSVGKISITRHVVLR